MRHIRFRHHNYLSSSLLISSVSFSLIIGLDTASLIFLCGQHFLIALSRLLHANVIAVDLARHFSLTCAFLHAALIISSTGTPK